jgi:hypothetical protein
MSGAQVAFVRASLLIAAAMATLAGMALFAAVMARRAVPAAALQRRRRPASPVPDQRS